MDSSDSKFVNPNSGFQLPNPSILAPESKFVRDPAIQPAFNANNLAGPQSTGASDSKFVVEQPKKKGPCCVCKETKFIRDECIRNNGMDKCEDFVAAHNACLRSEGFNVL